MNQPEDNFIGRWSRRKRKAGKSQSAVEQESALDAAELESLAAGEVKSAEHGSSNTEQQVIAATDPVGESSSLTDADMVDLETLDGDSDYAPFLSEGVSSTLRKAALKKLFFSGKFAVRDGLDDYDDDFTYFEPLGDTVTSDMKFHARRKEKQRLAKLEQEQLELEQQAEVQETVSDVTDESPDKEPVSEPEQTQQDSDDEVPAEQTENTIRISEGKNDLPSDSGKSS